MKIHGKMGFADFQEDDIQLPGFYTNIPPSRGNQNLPRAAPTFPGLLLKKAEMTWRKYFKKSGYGQFRAGFVYKLFCIYMTKIRSF